MRAFFQAAQFASLGLEMGLCVAIGSGIGWFLDSRLGTKPWLLLVFLLVGIAAAFKAVIDASKRATRASKTRDDEGKTDANPTTARSDGSDRPETH